MKEKELGKTKRKRTLVKKKQPVYSTNIKTVYNITEPPKFEIHSNIKYVSRET